MMRRNWRGAGRSVVCLALLWLGACADLPGRPDEADRPIRPNDVKSVDVLYGQNCAGCHGAEGRLGAARPLADPLYWAIVNDAEVQGVVARGVAGTAMPAFALSEGGTLSDAQIAILSDGLRTRWSGPDSAAPGLPTWAIQPGQNGKRGRVDQGAQVFASRCAVCHGGKGEGGIAPGSLVDASYLSLVSDQALRSAVLFGRTDLGMPDFRGGSGEKPLSPDEIADLVAWMASHRVAYPGRPYNESDAAGVGEDGP